MTNQPQQQLPPQNPAGKLVTQAALTQVERESIFAEMDDCPRRWKSVLEQIPHEGLDTKYRNWSIRQITHHIADSHANSYIRFKWALTENEPLIKAYDEAAWVNLSDSCTGTIDEPLVFLAGIHAQWGQLLRSMSESDFQKSFVHPETNSTHSLDEVLQYYPWHARHHLGQIIWIANQNGWTLHGID